MPRRKRGVWSGYRKGGIFCDKKKTTSKNVFDYNGSVRGSDGGGGGDCEGINTAHGKASEGDGEGGLFVREK